MKLVEAMGVSVSGSDLKLHVLKSYDCLTTRISFRFSDLPCIPSSIRFLLICSLLQFLPGFRSIKQFSIEYLDNAEMTLLSQPRLNQPKYSFLCGGLRVLIGGHETKGSRHSNLSLSDVLLTRQRHPSTTNNKNDAL